MKYELDEDRYVMEIMEYITGTYKSHYAKSGTQTIVEIINKGDGIGFSKGTIRKYMDRYGHKGTPEDHRKDILKLIHNGIFLLISHDKKRDKNESD